LRESVAFVAGHAPAIEPVPEIWNNLRSRIAGLPAPHSAPGLFGILAVNRWGGALATLAATLVLAVGLAAYYQYRQAQQLELQAFMAEYIQMRAVQERYHAMLIQDTIYDARDIRARAPIGVENPFAPPTRPAPGNPFTLEAR
jgi:anti-sigma-K factor RskA